MRLRNLIWKELRQRPTPMFTGLLTVTLGVTALVAIQHITISSEEKISQDMDTLGANVLVLPNSVSLDDYYSADMHGKTMPEEFVTRLALARLPGVQNLAPKLCLETSAEEHQFILTGILPKSEFQAKSAWQGLNLVANPIGSDRGCCETSATAAGADSGDRTSLASTRTIDELGSRELILGSDLASEMNVGIGEEISILGDTFQVSTILPATGTIDDSRAFAHLHSVQELAETGPVVNVIEIMACCDDAAGGLITDLEAELPEARVVTLAQIVETQVAVNGLMSRLSWVFFSILLLVGGASVASVMYANVTERRREIGTLMALGASRWLIARLFLGKAMLLGIFGGLGGFLLGAVLASLIGPGWLDIEVRLMPGLCGVGVAAATVVALAATYLPARRASLLDPCLVFGDS